MCYFLLTAIVKIVYLIISSHTEADLYIKLFEDEIWPKCNVIVLFLP